MLKVVSLSFEAKKVICLPKVGEVPWANARGNRAKRKNEKKQEREQGCLRSELRSHIIISFHWPSSAKGNK